MIGALTGKIFVSHQNPIILMVAGVGYAVHVPLRLATSLSIGDAKTFFIHTHVREDALDLYGFLTQKELVLFRFLLDVSGIGPRTALSIVDRGVDAVEHAIGTADVDFFTTIPRLGKKNAQKIIIELKNKLGSTTDLDLSEDAQGETGALLDALISMGFDRKEAVVVVKKISPTHTLEAKIREALKLLGRLT